MAIEKRKGVLISMFSRTSFFITVAFLSLMTSVKADPAQPNIVFIFCDDHAFQAISAYKDGRKLIETPNIDRLAREGMKFNRAVVPNSICGPSRACVLTGKYNHINGFYDNTYSRFDGAQPTFPKMLKSAGYQTAMMGKWHLISDPTGFDEWHILPGQGDYYNPDMIKNGQRLKHEGYTTDLITDFSLEWLNARDKNKPFLLMLQHKAPHRDWQPPARHLGHDKDRNYPEPESLFDDYANRGIAVRDQDMTIEKTMTPGDLKLVTPRRLNEEQLKAWNAYYEPRNEAFKKANPQGRDLVRWKYNRYMHDYLGCVKAVDDSVGRVLDYLDKNDLTKNTLVVYTSDQGFYLGEHGWFDKRWIFEESLRTPMLIRWPGKVAPGSENSQLASVIDFAPTFLEAAGLPIPADIQGKSMMPVLTGKAGPEWRKSFYYHYYEYPQPHHVRRHYGVVTDRYKLVHFYAPDVDYWELYDREKDPGEMVNMLGKPGYEAVEKELRAEVARLREELKVKDSDKNYEEMIRERQRNRPAAKKKAVQKAE